MDLFDIFTNNYSNICERLKSISHNDKSLGVSCIYHQEDTIFDHTRMVYEYMVNNSYDYDMLLAGILHDIGKIYTKQVIKRNDRYKIIYAGHQGYSTLMAGEIIDGMTHYFNYNFNKDRIIKIINYHDDSYAQGFNPNNYDVNTFDDLCCFSVADKNGAIRSEEIKKYDIDLFDYKYKVTDDENKFNGSIVTLFCGVPCSGKSTFLQNFKMNDKKIIVISSDNKIENYAESWGTTYNEVFKDQELIKEIMKETNEDFVNALEYAKEKNVSIFIDRTNTSVKSRKFFIDLLKKNKDIVARNAYVFLSSPKNIFARNRRKGKIIPQDVIHNMICNFKIPYYSEVGKYVKIFYN